MEIWGQVKIIQTTALLRWPEYCEESWKLVEIFCHSNSSEKQSANVYVKNNNNNNNVPHVKYWGQFLKWTREEIKEIEHRNWKLMTMYMVLHPRHDVDSLYVSRKEGGRGLASFEDSFTHHYNNLKTKVWRKTDYRHQKHYWQHEDQKDDNKPKTKWEEKQHTDILSD